MKRLALVLGVVGVIALASVGAYAVAEARAESATAPQEQAAVVQNEQVAAQPMTCHPLSDGGRCRSGDSNCASCPGFKDADKDGVCDVRGQCTGHQSGQGCRRTQQGRGCRFGGSCH